MSGATPRQVVVGVLRKQTEQASKQYHAMASALADPKLPVLTFHDEEWCGSVSQINLFFPKPLLVMVFHHSNSGPDRRCEKSGCTQSFACCLR